MQKRCQMYVYAILFIRAVQGITSVYSVVSSVLCVADSYPAGVPYANTTCCVHTLIPFHRFSCFCDISEMYRTVFMQACAYINIYYAGIVLLSS